MGANMAPSGVLIKTDVVLELVYVTDNCDDETLFNIELDKPSNWT